MIGQLTSHSFKGRSDPLNLEWPAHANLEVVIPGLLWCLHTNFVLYWMPLLINALPGARNLNLLNSGSSKKGSYFENIHGVMEFKGRDCSTACLEAPETDILISGGSLSVFPIYLMGDVAFHHGLILDICLVLFSLQTREVKSIHVSWQWSSQLNGTLLRVVAWNW